MADLQDSCSVCNSVTVPHVLQDPVPFQEVHMRLCYQLKAAYSTAQHDCVQETVWITVDHCILCSWCRVWQHAGRLVWVDAPMHCKSITSLTRGT